MSTTHTQVMAVAILLQQQDYQVKLCLISATQLNRCISVTHNNDGALSVYQQFCLSWLPVVQGGLPHVALCSQMSLNAEFPQHCILATSGPTLDTWC